MGDNPIKQHTVPCSYLQGFTKNPEKKRDADITVYDFSRKKSYSSAVKNVSIKSDFYTLEDKDGNKIYNVEKELGKKVEGITHIIDKINSKEQLSSDEAEQLSIFIGFQEFRTKYRFDWVNDNETMIMQKMMQMAFSNMETAQRTIESMERDTGKKFGMTAEKAVEELGKKAGNYKIENPAGGIRHMIESFHILAKRIVTTKWRVFYDNNGGFITSDHPLFLMKPEGFPEHMSVGIYNAGIGFPLSKYCYLNCPYEIINSYIMDEDRIIYQEVDEKMIRILNHYSASSVTERAFAKDKSTLQDIMDIDSGKTTPEEVQERYSSISIQI